MSAYTPDEESGTTSERFEYFMVRLTRSTHAPDRLAGLIERLGFGEKRSFETGEQLLRLVSGGFSDTGKMLPVQGHRNALGSTTPPVEDGS
jgi:hypothetical protein